MIPPPPALVHRWLPTASTYTTLGRTDCNHVDAATAAWRYQPSHRCGPTQESNATEVSYQHFLLRKCLLGRGLFEIGPSRCLPPAQLAHLKQAWAGDCWLTGDRWLLSLPYFTAELAQRGTSAAAISGPGSSLGSDPHRSIANCPVSRELTTPTLLKVPCLALKVPFPWWHWRDLSHVLQQEVFISGRKDHSLPNLSSRPASSDS